MTCPTPAGRRCHTRIGDQDLGGRIVLIGTGQERLEIA
jgi:hypothetical protein